MKEEKIISSEDVEKIASLARIEIDSDEKGKFAKEISSILEYFKDLNTVGTSGRERFDYYELLKNQFRVDEIDQIEDEEKQAIRDLFPDRKVNHLKVKEVLNGSH
ncbi:MAG: Asp-tRNA(Asn)/Glu-tRNA(Gln) amidotransferase subunit GatC [Patescibacteria group bacterium]|nr:Asp-tRNA(Asn)/Glu-tRNA(Gln) amidotransferase subunit GatC [Patescibacteria group bacterium]